MIAIEALRKDFGGVRALDGLSFSVGDGSLLGIVGPNGAGKSTLFDIIAGSLAPDSGSVTLDGTRIDGLPPHSVAARGVARTRQATRLFPYLSTLENVVAGAHLRASDSFLSHLLMLTSAKRERASIEASAREALARVGLADRAACDPRRLTEGERRRVGLARAMVSTPKALLLDELGAGLDPAETMQMRTAVADFARRSGAVVLAAERDLAACLGFCERVIVLHAGQKVSEGPPELVRREADVRDAYLGVAWRQ